MKNDHCWIAFSCIWAEGQTLSTAPLCTLACSSPWESSTQPLLKSTPKFSTWSRSNVIIPRSVKGAHGATWICEMSCMRWGCMEARPSLQEQSRESPPTRRDSLGAGKTSSCAWSITHMANILSVLVKNNVVQFSMLRKDKEETSPSGCSLGGYLCAWTVNKEEYKQKQM